MIHGASRRALLLLLSVGLLVNAAIAADVVVSDAQTSDDGWLVHEVTSPYQAGTTRIHVLPPEGVGAGRRYPVLYILPVEAGDGVRWGDARAEVEAHDLHNKHQLIFVYPTFSHLPWYADHPTDRQIRQESYFLHVVLPTVESHYPALAKPEGRMLVGFSKSGWGAYSLLLRHPNVFSRAAAWDAPLEEGRPERYGMGPIFGTQEQFQRYRISSLLEQRAKDLKTDRPRLVLTGYDAFRAQHVATHERMVALGIPHVYRDGPWRKHHWQSGWLSEAVELLAPSPER